MAVADTNGHATRMAGIGLYGPLESNLPVVLRRRLESVKLLPNADAQPHDPLLYGVVTAQAVATPEVASDRQRVYCMPISAPADFPGEPSLWSATVDALAMGTDISDSDDGIALLGEPDAQAKRLIVIAAGNVGHPYERSYLDHCDTSPIDDPAQAWNALTVGAYTELVDTPSDPSYSGWTPLAEAGQLSPHSRTSVMFGPGWPIKPDICMEGGNVLFDGVGDFHESHPLLGLQTTDRKNDEALSSAHATSAATAAASGLCAMAMARYPSYWPETIRGLMTHRAQWTSAMRTSIDQKGSNGKRKQDQLVMLRRYGWGVPTEDAVLNSHLSSVTLVSQDEFVPFQGPEHKARLFRLHQLPWPTDELAKLNDGDIKMRVTLSYFIEPTASKRGWRGKFTYRSHGLRFELRNPDPPETTEEFIRRVNRQAELEEDGTTRRSDNSNAWLVGPN